MKKIAAFLLALSMILTMTAALADGRTAPADKKLIETDDVIGAHTQFRKYDNKFWDAESEQPGTVVKMEYTTDVYGDTVTNWLNVYLPYGYDETKQYDIMYFFHGTNETPDSFIEDARAKNCLDNMVETGVADPFIMVFPTYYYNYADRATDKELFCQEMRQDIMPLIESTYSTYAPTADTEGFIASREHRAISGYSQGSWACWVAMENMLDVARWWLPLSAATNVAELKAAITAQGDYDWFVYYGVGGPRDMMYESTVAMFQEITADDFFSFGNDLHANNIYCTISAEVHQTLIGRFYLYNAFCDGLMK